MCLVVLAHKMDNKYPILLGANREESCVRPASDPCVSKGEAIWAGEDRGPTGAFDTAGTWMGLSKAGFIVALTNRDDGVFHDKNQEKSRGLLVARMLSKVTMATAYIDAYVELLRGGYGGCNLLIADKDLATIIHAPSANNIKMELLDPGLHVLTNLNINDPNDVRINLMKAKLDVGRFEESAKEMLRHPDIIVHDDDWGTIASSILMTGKESTRFLHINGKPTGVDYRCYSDLTMPIGSPLSLDDSAGR